MSAAAVPLLNFAANAASLGAHAVTVRRRDELLDALADAKKQTRTTLIVVETDREQRVPGYESWWDVPVAEVSEIEAVRQARAEYEKHLRKERDFL